jgi:hypothetical protein
MALIIDPDQLTDGQEIVIDTTSKTIALVEVDALSDDGVTIKCVYSKLKELWKDNATYIKFPFPMTPITDEQFEVVNGWDWADDATRYLLRTGGWALKSEAGVTLEEWAGIISLGTLGASDQVYFQQDSTSAAVNIQLTGPVNQAIKIYDFNTGDDFRSYLRLFCREWQKSYAYSQLADIGVSTMTYQAYRFPLANATDVKVTHTENDVDTLAPYTGMAITWYNSVQTESGFVGGDAYFHVIIDGNSGTAEQIYEYVQRQLRKNSDIDAGSGTQIGKVTNSILRFVGDTLYTYLMPEGGTFIDNYLAVDKNRLVFVEDDGDERIYPYVSVLTINFGDNLQDDAASKYWVFFTGPLPNGANYGESDALLVNDADSIPITGLISGNPSVQATFDYDGNVQGGRSSGTNAPITAVAIGLSTGQFVKATATIEKSKSNSVSLVAALERNYSNPA